MQEPLWAMALSGVSRAKRGSYERPRHPSPTSLHRSIAHLPSTVVRLRLDWPPPRSLRRGRGSSGRGCPCGGLAGVGNASAFTTSRSVECHHRWSSRCPSARRSEVSSSFSSGVGSVAGRSLRRPLAPFPARHAHTVPNPDRRSMRSTRRAASCLPYLPRSSAEADRA